MGNHEGIMLGQLVKIEDAKLAKTNHYRTFATKHKIVFVRIRGIIAF